jgi:hypothetical protein
MSFINSINLPALLDKLNKAEQSIYLVMPGIDDEVAGWLIHLKKEKKISINVCVDNDEAVIRNGYGDAVSIDNLLMNNISVRQSGGNRISFMVTDSQGYLLFPESRILSESILSEKPIGTNALTLDPFTITRLVNHFFSPQNPEEKLHLLERFTESFDQQHIWLQQLNNEIDNGVISVSEDFNKTTFEKTKESLKKIPPTEPDLQRRIRTYTTKVQFVELKFSGINLKARTINIPKTAIPINNEELKNLLFTKMKLFQNIEENESLKIFSELKKKVEVLRDDYLKSITCREGKSIIQVEMKEAFRARLEKIKNEIKEINKDLPDILEKASMPSKNLIVAESIKFYSANPAKLPSEIAQYKDNALREKKLKEYVEQMVSNIFPKTSKLIEKITLKDYYYDLTFQDFSDDNFIKELQKKEIVKEDDIKDIVEMKNAFSERR